MSGHHCHPEGCEVPVPPRMFMCLKHWPMVPRLLQREIWKYYRPGQERDMNPSADYMRVARQAIRAVAEKEGRIAPTPTIGSIRCRRCNLVHAEVPPGWNCVRCGGEVSQNIGTIVVPGRPVPPHKPGWAGSGMP